MKRCWRGGGRIIGKFVIRVRGGECEVVLREFIMVVGCIDLGGMRGLR